MTSARSSHNACRGRSLERPHPKPREHRRSQSRPLSTPVHRLIPAKALPHECSRCRGISVGNVVRVFSWSADAWVDAEVVQVDDDSFLRVEYMVDATWYGKILHVGSRNLAVPSSDGIQCNRTHDSSDFSDNSECDPCGYAGSGFEMDAFKAGELVIVDGLQQRPELNGFIGVVLPLTSELRTRGRVGVALAANNDGALSVRPSSLRQIERAQTLKKFFESEYQFGLDFEDSTDYQKHIFTMQVTVYKHLATGILVWTNALDLRRGDQEGFQVLFHYTGELAFSNIVDFRKEYAEVWASLKNPVPDIEQPDTRFGEGVYASCREPREWKSKEQILINNFCSVDDCWKGRADFCIPLLVPISLLRECRTMKFGRHTGRDIQEHFQSHVVTVLQHHGIPLFERDVWLVEVKNEIGAVTNAMSSFEKTFKAQVQIREKIKGPKHEDTLDSYNTLATCLKAKGKAHEAESWFWKFLKGNEEAHGKMHPSTLISYDNYAMCLSRLGRAREAESWHKKALDDAEAMLGRNHVPILLKLYNNFAMCLDAQGKAQEAEPWYEKSLKGSEKALGKTHPETLISYNNFAERLRDQGKARDAERWHRKTLKAREDRFGKKHPDTLQSYENLAMSLEDQALQPFAMSVKDQNKLLRKAEEIHRDVLESREHVLGRKHPATVQSYNNLAGCLYNQMKASEAEPLYKKVLELREESLGQKHPDTLTSYMNLAVCLSTEKQAGPWYQKALKGAEEVMGKGHSKTQKWRREYELYLKKQKR